MPLALLLTQCESQATVDKSRAIVLPPPTTLVAKTPDAAYSAAASSSVRVVTLRLPDAPSFEVPQVELPNALAAHRINQLLTRLLLTNYLEDTTQAPTAAPAVHRAVAEYKANNQIGLTGTGFQVLFNRAGLLSLTLTTETVGAYPSTSISHATFDTRTGRLVTLPQLLTDTLALRQQWHQRLTKRVANYLQTMAYESPSNSDDQATVREHTGWNDATHEINAAALPPLRDFALTAKGLVLYSAFDFPHVVLALAPPDDYLFTYAELKPWLPARSPLLMLLGRVQGSYE